MTKRIAIIGRANTGKSSLFNALIGKKLAIVDDVPGITRDIKEEWLTDNNGKAVKLLDSGGYVENFNSDIDKHIVDKVYYLMDNADALILVLDAKTGITKEDYHLINIIRKKNNNNIILVANKVDNKKDELEATEFYSLGIEPLFFVSAIHKKNINKLKNFLLNKYGSPISQKDEKLSNIPKIAIVGRTNTGKSTLINAYFGENLRIVSDKPGTTRDVGKFYYNKYGFEFFLLDTAGIRRRKIMRKEDVEFYSYLRTTKAIQEADICILLLDAKEGITHRDLNIVNSIQKELKPLIIAINKWDLVKNKNVKEYNNILKNIFGDPLIYPVHFISATQKKNIYKLLKSIQKVLENAKQKIPTRELNEKILPILKDNAPPPVRGKSVKIKFLQYAEGKVPTFLIFSNYPNNIPKHYIRFIEKQIRKHYDFTGVPIRIVLKKS